MIRQSSAKEMTIALKAKIAIGLLSVVTAIAIVTSFIQGNQLRLGGPLDLERRSLSDLVADVLPPPAYVIEPWLEVNQLHSGFGDPADHIARLKTLRKNYEARKTFWISTEFNPELKGELRRALRESDTFWIELENSFVPALKAGDPQRIEQSFGALSQAYQRHREAIDLLVTKAADEQATLDAASEKTIMRTLIILGIMAALLLGGISGLGQFILYRGLNPLSAIATSVGEGLERLASGDLTHRISKPFPAEHDHLRSSFNRTGETLNTLFANFAQTASHVDVASAEIRAASADLSHRTEGNANAINATATTMSEVAAMVLATKDAMLELDSAMQQASQEASEGQQIVRAAMEAMQGIERSSATIAQITQLIDGIAFQTNLLALNAGVEAARAGEAGKGFAVVASEVRALAQRAAASAKEIGDLVAASNQQVHLGVSGVGSTEAKFNAIVERIQQIGQTLTGLVESSNQQAQITAKVNASITDMDRNTQQNASMAEECNAAAASLAAQSQSLNAMLGAFQTSDQVQAPSPKPTPSLQTASTTPPPIELPALRARSAAPAFNGNAALALSNDDWAEF